MGRDTICGRNHEVDTVDSLPKVHSDGGRDPQDHIIHFKRAMIPTCIPDQSGACAGVTISLSGRLCFGCLPSYGVDSFHLARLFDPFASDRQYRKDGMIYLGFSEKESLRDNIQRFNDMKARTFVVLEEEAPWASVAVKEGIAIRGEESELIPPRLGIIGSENILGTKRWPRRVEGVGRIEAYRADPYAQVSAGEDPDIVFLWRTLVARSTPSVGNLGRWNL
ncbi:hypothetical protein FNV43_RR17383 [Rhamnella rubrinervis]|uniref:Uncharacterized protein n=1 Tax=Rhamnella rubrinervis TaxID=2594499 RepID=A0A8K0GVP0_9ROSA|nr:hypothetical protein FNV43_RR17383 [Rhamnella rubrinervis]